MTGRVGSLPKITNEINGKKLVRFTFSIKASCISDGCYIQRTQWYTVNLIGNAAEDILNKCLHIGDKIMITGNWLIDNYSDQFGNKRYSYEIYAENVERMHIHEEKVA